MGVRHLETFLKQYVPNGVHETSIENECRRYQSCCYGLKPTLVIDLMGLVQMLSTDNISMLLGGRHWKIHQNFENFLIKLSSFANLVFFEDGPVVNNKFQTWLKRHNEKYSKMIAVIDSVNAGVPLEEIVQRTRDLPTVTSILSMIEKTAKKYGRLIVTVTKECDAELVQFANIEENHVLAVIADDSDFLIFGGNWRYFSLKNLNMETFVTLEYSKIALRSHLGLDFWQLQVLSTIGGNDIILYDEVRGFHAYYCGHNAKFKFPWLAGFIREQMPEKFGQIVTWIANDVLLNSSKEAKDRISESLKQYKTKFDLPTFTDPLLKFCRDNNFDFVFSTLHQMPKNFTMNYFDLRAYPNFFGISNQLFCKQIGIILQHKRQKISYEICVKTKHDEGYKKIFVEPIYPEVELPPLLELLNRADFLSHDEIRFKLLKWMIDERKLENVDLAAIPKNYFLDILTLTWLTFNQFISVLEADLILLSIKHVELKLMPQNLQPPRIVHPRAFHVSFLFTQFYLSIKRSLSIVGLKKQMAKILNFDGVLFHKMYWDMTEGFNPQPLLLDLKPYRLYDSSIN